MRDKSPPLVLGTWTKYAPEMGQRLVPAVTGCGDMPQVFLVFGEYRLIHPLILANIKDDPSRALRSGLIVAIGTGVLLARTGLVNASHGIIAHWLSSLLGIVFWVCFGIAVLEKYVDVVERNHDFGILRILGASNTYIFTFLLQETIITSIPGALLGLVLGYIVSGLFEVLSGGFVSMPIPYLWWPVISAIATSASLVGATLAIPRAVRDGVAEALESSDESD